MAGKSTKKAATKKNTATRKTATKSAKVAKQAAVKRVAAKAPKPCTTAPRSQSRKASKPALLAGGNPQIAKADGDALAFFRGASLRPVPPGESKHQDVRYLDIHEDDQLDEVQLAAWVKQASRLPGWGKA
jgi:hypothetical protein